MVQISNVRDEFATYKCQVNDKEKEWGIEKKALQQEIKHLKHECDRGEKKLKGFEKTVAEKHSKIQLLRDKLANKDMALEQAKQKLESQGGKGRLKVAELQVQRTQREAVVRAQANKHRIDTLLIQYRLKKMEKENELLRADRTTLTRAIFMPRQSIQQ